MICLFAHSDKISDDIAGIVEGMLPDWRVKTAYSYMSECDRKASVLGYFMVAAGLEQMGVYAGMPQFGYGKFGKPYLLNYPGVEFNISHCKSGVAVVLDSARVGIDVEDTMPFDAELARAVCSDEEFDSVCAAPSPAEAFTLLWTRKEALSKFCGEGISDVEHLKPILRDDSVNIVSYRLAGGEMYMSLCMEKRKINL